MLSLFQKLKLDGIKSICVINPPDDYHSLIQPLPKDLIIHETLTGMYDQVHLFVKSESELKKQLNRIENCLNEKGMLWVCYPKQTSVVKASINRDSGWKILEKSKLRSVAFISIDKMWTAFGLRNEPKELLSKKRAADSEFIDNDKRIITVPDDLSKLFIQNKNAKEWFEKLSFTNRKEFIVWITSAKKVSIRVERLTKTIQKLNDQKKNPSEK